MNERITDGLLVYERCIRSDGIYYTRYTPNFFIDNGLFAKAIESLGGYVYNLCVGKIGEVIVYNGLTWLAVHDTQSYENCDMWAERTEKAIYEAIGATSPIHIHHPVPRLHTWGIEFNRDRPFWDNPADKFVAEARKLLDSGWFYQSGSDHSDKGYQFFEYLGNPSVSKDSICYEKPEFIVRSHAIKIAKEISSIVMF